MEDNAGYHRQTTLVYLFLYQHNSEQCCLFFRTHFEVVPVGLPHLQEYEVGEAGEQQEDRHTQQGQQEGQEQGHTIGNCCLVVNGKCS